MARLVSDVSRRSRTNNLQQVLRWAVIIGSVAAPAVAQHQDESPLDAPRPGSELPALRVDFAGQEPVRVVQILSGECLTVRLPQGVTLIRLLGVETGRPEAKDEIQDLLKDRRVFLKCDADRPRDLHGRLLAYVFRSQDGLFLNLELIQRGYARAAEEPGALGAYLVQAERLARADFQGLWATNEIDKIAPHSSLYAANLRKALESRRERFAWGESQRIGAIQAALAGTPSSMAYAMSEYEGRKYLGSLRRSTSAVPYGEVLVKNRGGQPLRVIFRCQGRKEQEIVLRGDSSRSFPLPAGPYEVLVGPFDDSEAPKPAGEFTLTAGASLELGIGGGPGGADKPVPE